MGSVALVVERVRRFGRIVNWILTREDECLGILVMLLDLLLLDVLDAQHRDQQDQNAEQEQRAEDAAKNDQ